MHWKWLIIVYLFLGGLGAGAYLTSFMAEKGWLGKGSSLNKIGFYLSWPIVAIGTVLLIFDLGQGMTKPWLLIGLLKNFTSVMTWGVYILAIFMALGFVKSIFVWKEKKAPEIINWLGAFFAIATGMYTGLLLTVIDAVPFWASYIMPFLFVISALSTGISITVIVSLFVYKDKYVEGKEGPAHIWLILAEIVLVAIFMGTMYFGSNGPVGQESAELLISGVYSVVFWGYFVALGLIVPLIIFIYQSMKPKKPAVAKKSIPLGTVATDAAVIIGGFCLRTVVVLAAIPVWDGNILL